MDYFVCKQDPRYTTIPMLQGIRQQLDTRDLQRESAHKIPDPLIFYVQTEAETHFLDILDRQLYLLSDRLKRVMEAYVPDTLFKLTSLINLKAQRQDIYYLPFFEEVEALSPRSEFNRDRSVLKTLILQEEKIHGKKIIRVKESVQPLIIVRLDVAESILRRDFLGVHLERVPLE